MVRAMVPWTNRLPRPLESLENEMRSLMDRFMGREDGGWFEHAGEFFPTTNVAETDTSIEVSIELPGMKAEDLTIEFRNGTLWVAGERKEEKEDKSKTWHRVESHYGAFRRVVPLATDVDQDKVSAHFADGVLKVTLPKAATAQPRRIEVKSS